METTMQVQCQNNILFLVAVLYKVIFLTSKGEGRKSIDVHVKE